jgi:hypothetical protein
MKNTYTCLYKRFQSPALLFLIHQLRIQNRQLRNEEIFRSLDSFVFKETMASVAMDDDGDGNFDFGRKDAADDAPIDVIASSSMNAITAQQLMSDPHRLPDDDPGPTALLPTTMRVGEAVTDSYALRNLVSATPQRIIEWRKERIDNDKDLRFLQTFAGVAFLPSLEACFIQPILIDPDARERDMIVRELGIVNEEICQIRLGPGGSENPLGKACRILVKKADEYYRDLGARLPVLYYADDVDAKEALEDIRKQDPTLYELLTRQDRGLKPVASSSSAARSTNQLLPVFAKFNEPITAENRRSLRELYDVGMPRIIVDHFEKQRANANGKSLDEIDALFAKEETLRARLIRIQQRATGNRRQEPLLSPSSITMIESGYVMEVRPAINAAIDGAYASVKSVTRIPVSKRLLMQEDGTFAQFARFAATVYRRNMLASGAKYATKTQMNDVNREAWAQQELFRFRLHVLPGGKLIMQSRR